MTHGRTDCTVTEQIKGDGAVSELDGKRVQENHDPEYHFKYISLFWILFVTELTFLSTCFVLMFFVQLNTFFSD